MSDSCVKEIFEQVNEDAGIEKLKEISKRIQTISEMTEELIDLRKKEAEIVNRLSVLIDKISIEELDMSARTYHCLCRAGFNTIIDILDFPQNEWQRVRNLGEVTATEIEEKMHELGFSTFRIKR